MKTFFFSFWRSPDVGRQNRLNFQFRPENSFESLLLTLFIYFSCPRAPLEFTQNKLLVPPQKIYFRPPPPPVRPESGHASKIIYRRVAVHRSNRRTVRSVVSVQRVVNVVTLVCTFKQRTIVSYPYFHKKRVPYFFAKIEAYVVPYFLHLNQRSSKKALWSTSVIASCHLFTQTHLLSINLRSYAA